MRNVVIIFFLFISFYPAYSKTYICPSTPITIKKGQQLKDKWWVEEEKSRLNRIITYLIPSYTSLYHFKHWNVFPSGRVSKPTNKSKYYIGCCGWLEKEKKSICAYKLVKESTCKPILKRQPRMRFEC